MFSILKQKFKLQEVFL